MRSQNHTAPGVPFHHSHKDVPDLRIHPPVVRELFAASLFGLEVAVPGGLGSIPALSGCLVPGLVFIVAPLGRLER